MRRASPTFSYGSLSSGAVVFALVTLAKIRTYRLVERIVHKIHFSKKNCSRDEISVQVLRGAAMATNANQRMWRKRRISAVSTSPLIIDIVTQTKALSTDIPSSYIYVINIGFSSAFSIAANLRLQSRFSWHQVRPGRQGIREFLFSLL